jgi:hypothetical protein
MLVPSPTATIVGVVLGIEEWDGSIVLLECGCWHGLLTILTDYGIRKSGCDKQFTTTDRTDSITFLIHSIDGVMAALAY